MSRIALMITLIVAGEMVFALPFHTARFFRPTMLDVFGFSNTQLGDVFAVYGVTAMLAYFPGGALADRFSARSMLSISLLVTAAGGLYMATIPSARQMTLLYGFWGVSTILLFWGALIRATRAWGGNASQGMAFGILDGGRGLVAAAFAGVVVFAFASFLPTDVASASNAQRREGFQTVVLMYSAATAFAAALAWFLIPDDNGGPAQERGLIAGMRVVISRPIVWAQAGVIVCAYCGYKGLDNYSLYAVQVLGMDEVQSAKFSTYGAYLRPIGAVAAGIIADRFGAARSIVATFALLALVYLALGLVIPGAGRINFVYLNVFVSFFAVFALRGIYFALLQENKTPIYLTGATVGMVSLVGYTPEIFFAPIAGRILDATPGVGGHLDYFRFLSAIAVLGLFVSFWLLRLQRQSATALWPKQR